MILLYDPKTGEQVRVRPEHAREALRSGLTMAKGQTVDLVDVDGNVGSVGSPMELDQALAGGGRIETEDEAHKRHLEEKYGDRDLAAFGAGAARALSFGLSDHALTSLEITDRETLAGLQDANPTASTAGEIVGLTGSMLLPGGQLGAVGRLARGATALPRLAGTAGRLAAKSAVKETARRTLAREVLEKAAQAGIGGGVEGAIYGAGKFLSDKAIKDPDMTAETMLAYMGLGALTGGGAGAGLSAGGTLMSHGVKRASTLAKAAFTRSFKESLDELATESAVKATGARGSDIRKLGSQKKVDQIGRDLLDHRLRDGSTILKAGDKADDMLPRLRTAAKEVGEDLGSMRDKVDDFIETKATELRPDVDAYLAKVDDEVLAPLKASAVASVRKKAVKVERELAELRGAGRMRLRDLEKVRRDLADIVYPKKAPGQGLPPQPPEHVQELMRAERMMADLIEDTTEQAVGKMGGAAGEYARLKRLNESFIKATKMAEKADLQDLGNRALSPSDYGFGLGGAGLSMMTGGVAPVATGAASAVGHNIVRERGRAVVARLADKASKLAAVQRASKTIGDSIDDNMTKFLSRFDGSKRAPLASMPTAAVALQSANYGARVAGHEEKAIERAEQLARLVADPEALADQIASNLLDIEDAAPAVAQRTAALAAQAAGYLHSKAQGLFPSPGHVTLQPQHESRRYDRRRVAKFARYVEAVEQPTKVFERLARGEVSIEGVETLRALYPRLYQLAQTRMVEAVSKLPRKLTLEESTKISLFMGAPTSAMLTPGFLSRQQTMYRQPQGGQGPNGLRLTGLEQLETASQHKIGADGREA